MKIAFVCRRFYPHIGGVETAVLQLASHMAAKGIDVTVLTQTNDKNFVKKEKIHNFTILRFSEIGFSELQLSTDLLRYLQKNSDTYDIIHTQNYHAFPALSASITKKTPLIFSPHYHGTGHTFFTHILHYPYRLIGKFIFANANAVLCVSEAEAQLIQKHFSKSIKTHVIPLGIDVTGIQKTKKYVFKTPYILSVGRLESYKNMALIIKSLSFIKGETNLIILGDGPEKEQLKKLAKKLNLSERIIFFENISNEKLFQLLKGAKAYVTMSRMEAYGLSLLEAVAARIGIVVSDIPAHKELINKFMITNISLLNPNSSPEILAASIEIAMNKPSQIGSSVPSWKYVTDQTLEVYKKILKRNAK